MTRGEGVRGKKHGHRKIILDNGFELFYKCSIPSQPRGVIASRPVMGKGCGSPVMLLTESMARGAGVSQLKGPDTTVRTRDRGSDPDGDRVLAGLQWPLQQFSTTRQASSGGVIDTSRPSMKAAREAPPSAPTTKLRRAEPALSSPPGTLRAARPRSRETVPFPLHLLSLPDWFRQSMITAVAPLPKPAFMDIRNECGHDKERARPAAYSASSCQVLPLRY